MMLGAGAASFRRKAEENKRTSTSASDGSEFKTTLKWWHTPPRQFLSPFGRAQYASWSLDLWWRNVSRRQKNLKVAFLTECASDKDDRRGVGLNRFFTPWLQFLSDMLDATSSFGRALRFFFKETYVAQLLAEITELHSHISVCNCEHYDASGKLNQRQRELVSSQKLDPSVAYVYNWLRDLNDLPNPLDSSGVRAFVAWNNKSGLSLVLDVENNVMQAFLEHGNAHHGGSHSAVTDEEIYEIFRASAKACRAGSVKSAKKKRTDLFQGLSEPGPASPLTTTGGFFNVPGGLPWSDPAAKTSSSSASADPSGALVSSSDGQIAPDSASAPAPAPAPPQLSEDVPAPLSPPPPLFDRLQTLTSPGSHDTAGLFGGLDGLPPLDTDSSAATAEVPHVLLRIAVAQEPPVARALSFDDPKVYCCRLPDA